MSGPSSLNVSTYTLRRPSTVSNASFRRPSSRGLVYMHKDSLLVPHSYKLSHPGMVSAGSSTCHLGPPQSTPQVPPVSVAAPAPTMALPYAPPPQRRCSTSARLERQKSHRDEDNPPAFLDVPSIGVEAEPGGDSLSPLPNRKMLFRRQGSQTHFSDTPNMSIYDNPMFPVPFGSTRKLTNQGQDSNESETSLSKSFNILTPPTIVEIGCSNPDLTVIQNNAAPPQISIFQNTASAPSNKSSSLLSTNLLLKPPEENVGPALNMQHRDVQETCLNIPASTDRRNSSPHFMALSNLSLYSDDDANKEVKSKRLRDAFAKSQSQSRPEVTKSHHELAKQGSISNNFNSSLKESISSSSSKGFQDSHSSSSGLSTMANAATTVSSPIPPEFSPIMAANRFNPRGHRSRRQSGSGRRRHNSQHNSYHFMLRLRTRRTCSQSYCVCKNCIRYIDTPFQNFSSDLYYVLVTRKLWPGLTTNRGHNRVTAPLDIFSFLKQNDTCYPHKRFKLKLNIVHRQILILLADKIKTSL